MEFEDCFSFEAIVGDLIRWRVAGKGMRDEDGRSDVEGVLPPRRMWSRAGAKARKGVAPAAVRRQAIWRTVLRVCGERGGGGTERPSRDNRPAMTWAQKLLRFVEDVRGRVMEGVVEFEKPRMIDIIKGYKDGRPECRRVASFERLADRVVLSRMTVYVRDRLEGVLSPDCYSFRADSSITHQTAVERLQHYRAGFGAGTLFVAECDIQKFFDNISHDTVRRRWTEVGFDARAGKVLEAYLRAYSAGKAGRGLPQGGSLSTVLANLVLAEADGAVERESDGRLFYARYCDDVVFVHPDADACRRAMTVYGAALGRLGLPAHPVRPFVYKPPDGTSTAYYGIKSKGPFRWREAASGEENCAPWLSFLGSQIRFDGETRIRRDSIEKHIRSLGRETARAVRKIEAGELDGVRPHDAAAWFARFRNRLIAKGVGYVTAKVEDCRMCWAGAFPNVTACADTKMQMRRLDRVREGMLCKVWRMVPERLKTGRHRYKGRPFSYCGFLEKAVRPANRMRRRVLLPYSEL